MSIGTQISTEFSSMKLHTKQHSIEHPWEKVTLAIWQKYPNPFASHVLTCDVVDRHIDEQGILHTTRIFTKKGKLPSWGSKLFNIKEAYILETSTVNPKTKEMKTVTKNLSHSKLLLVQDTQTILSQFKHTVINQEVTIVSNTGFIPIRDRIEHWGLDRFRKNSWNSSQGLLHVLKLNQMKLGSFDRTTTMK